VINVGKVVHSSGEKVDRAAEISGVKGVVLWVEK